MTGRTLRIVLICSLVVNIFLIGGLVGAGIVWKRVEAQRPLAGMGRPQRLRLAAMSLSPQYRRQLRRVVTETVLSLRPQAEEARAARQEAGRLLVQPRLDRAALDAAITGARVADVAIRTRLESSVIDFAATLPVSERIALGDALVRMGRQGQGAKGDGNRAPTRSR